MCLMAQTLARRARDQVGPRFKIPLETITSQSFSRYQLNQLGGKAASESILTCRIDPNERVKIAGY